MDLDTIIQRALSTQQMDHAFQPIWDVAGTLLGFEALARFDGAEPLEVFQRAKAMGVGIQLDRLSFRTALETGSVLPGLLFLNMDASHVGQPVRPFGTTGAAIAAFRRRSAVVMEVTESATDDVPLAAAGARRVQRLGVALALDDAGAGSSNFTRLRWLNPAYVKIDRAVIVEWASGQPKRLRQWVERSRRVGALVIAEGVEDLSWEADLEDEGVSYIQGWATGRPAPAEEWAERLLRDYPADVWGEALNIFAPLAFGEPAASDPGHVGRVSALTVPQVAELLYSSLPHSICVLNDDGYLVGMNSRAEGLFGAVLETMQAVPAGQLLNIRLLSTEEGPDSPPLSGTTLKKSGRYPALIGLGARGTLRADLEVRPVVHSGRSYTILTIEDPESSPARPLPSWTHRDPLTRCLSRLYWEREKAHLAALHGSVVFLDLDGFKTVNDLYGHAEGDRILGRAGAILLDAVKDTGLVVRYGGDEFLLVLPEASLAEASSTAEAARRLCSQQLGVGTSPTLPVSFQYGAAVYEAGDIDRAVQDADHRLYEKKGILLSTASGARFTFTAEGRRNLLDVTELARPQAARQYAPEVLQAQWVQAFEQSDEDATSFVEWADVRRGEAVVEVSAGPGRITIGGHLAEAVGEEGLLVATDTSLPLLIPNIRRWRPLGYPWVRYLVCPPDHLPVATGSADKVLLAHVGPALETASAWREWIRVLRPAGEAIAVVSLGIRTWPDVWVTAWEHVGLPAPVPLHPEDWLHMVTAETNATRSRHQRRTLVLNDPATTLAWCRLVGPAVAWSPDEWDELTPRLLESLGDAPVPVTWQILYAAFRKPPAVETRT